MRRAAGPGDELAMILAAACGGVDLAKGIRRSHDVLGFFNMACWVWRHISRMRAAMVTVQLLASASDIVQVLSSSRFSKITERAVSTTVLLKDRFDATSWSLPMRAECLMMRCGSEGASFSWGYFSQLMLVISDSKMPARSSERSPIVWRFRAATCEQNILV